MKKGALFVLFGAVLLFSHVGYAAAQEVEFNPCDPQQVEFIDEELCAQQEENPFEEPIEVDTNTKGEPNPETQAGNEQITPQTGVLGASTTAQPQVLAATGIEAWVFVLTGTALVIETSILYTVHKKEQ